MKKNSKKSQMEISIFTCEREPLTCCTDKSLVLDWNLFIISAIETNGAADSRTYTFLSSFCIVAVEELKLKLPLV